MFRASVFWNSDIHSLKFFKRQRIFLDSTSQFFKDDNTISWFRLLSLRRLRWVYSCCLGTERNTARVSSRHSSHNDGREISWHGPRAEVERERSLQESWVQGGHWPLHGCHRGLSFSQVNITSFLYSFSDCSLNQRIAVSLDFSSKTINFSRNFKMLRQFMDSSKVYE